jgi:hypothetical protein
VSFDNSRFPFDPTNDFCGVVMQQGRVQLDSDWNEWLAELSRRTQAGTLDTLGRAVYPATTPFAFHITASSPGGKNTLTIGPGRLYVDGLLAENHGDPNAAQWDPALAEMSCSPQPPPSTETGSIDYTQQPYMPANTPSPGSGPYLVYLDVWIRPVTYLEYPELVDKAVGIDTTGRLQTAWQVKLFDLANSPGATCSSSIPGWPPPPSAGLLTTGTAPLPPSGPCCLTSGAAYTGMENQFYRVQIHQAGSAVAGATPPSPLPPGTATFKWSRDNASVMTGVTNISSAQNSEGNPAIQLTVQSLGRDQVLGFAPGNWIELLDDNLEFSGNPGELHQIDSVDYTAKTITLADNVTTFSSGDTSAHTRIQRWDQSGNVYLQDGTTVWWNVDSQGGDIPVPPTGTALLLENGIIVKFDLDPAITWGAFLTGDFWTFAARTADGSVEDLNRAHPRGIHHHYTKLAIVTFPSSASDCRTPWPPTSTGTGSCGCCCTVTVGDGVESVGQFTSIQKAIDTLTDGGEVCILPGRYFENIFVVDRQDIVLRGCGWQTRIASASLAPVPPVAASAPGAASANTFAAVITVASSRHIQLLSFAVEAAEGEVGILLDGTGKLAQQPANTVNVSELRVADIIELEGVLDVTLRDLVLTASTLPAVLANRVRLLQIEGNRVAMQDLRTQWPAIWVSGIEIRILRNWVGIQNAATDTLWLPLTVASDLSNAASGGGSTPVSGVAEAINETGSIALNSGGIQIAGPSQDVFVLENEIEGGRGNGITLGSLLVLDSNGNDTGTVIGVLPLPEDPCATTGTLQIPISVPGTPGTRFVAGGKLINIQIDRNRIRNMGMCGIGPVGFFDLQQELEIISVENLTISSNGISRTLLRGATELTKQAAASLGYGAICVPDASNLVIRDNSIVDFGPQPGVNVCGIFLLNAEMADISGNQVLETRDWTAPQQSPPGPVPGARGGIVIYMVTPPSFSAPPALAVWGGTVTVSSPDSVPIHQPSLPALRVHNNVVRVPLSVTLEVVGLGPFSIRGNELSCGGIVSTEGKPAASTVLIFNLGAAIETAAAGRFSTLQGTDPAAFNYVGTTGTRGVLSNGTVLFTSNVCQLEARASRQRAVSSVLILSLDSLIFGDNLCWVDGPPVTAYLDAFLAAGTVQVTSNRFQEAALFSVLASGLTLGGINITAQNISTYCLFKYGILKPAIDANNVELVGDDFCKRMLQQLNLKGFAS